MQKLDDREAEDARQAFKAQLKPIFPTMVNVVSLAGETSKQMREENRRRRETALRQRQQAKKAGK